jgi:hypothetical protein
MKRFLTPQRMVEIALVVIVLLGTAAIVLGAR